MKKLVLFVTLAMFACPAVSLAGDSAGEAQARKVRGSKSNTSERAVAPTAGADETTKVKGSTSKPDSRSSVKSGKSNSSSY